MTDFGRDRKHIEAGIILWEEKILERDRKEKGWNNSLKERCIRKR
jgi:hypothetical protein